MSVCICGVCKKTIEDCDKCTGDFPVPQYDCKLWMNHKNCYDKIKNREKKKHERKMA